MEVKYRNRFQWNKLLGSEMDWIMFNDWFCGNIVYPLGSFELNVLNI